MSKYNMPPIDLFGKRCRIKHVLDLERGFVYRIVNSGVRSNCWKELPLGRYGNEAILHDHMEDIVYVVCDTLIDEYSEIERVALKDIEIMQGETIPLDKVEQAKEKISKSCYKACITDDGVIRCPAAHCGRCYPQIIFGGFLSQIVRYKLRPHNLSGMTADCRSLISRVQKLVLLKQGHDINVTALYIENFINRESDYRQRRGLSLHLLCCTDAENRW